MYKGAYVLVSFRLDFIIYKGQLSNVLPQTFSLLQGKGENSTKSIDPQYNVIYLQVPMAYKRQDIFKKGKWCRCVYSYWDSMFVYMR